MFGYKVFSKNTSKEYNDWCIFQNLNLDVYYQTGFLEQDAILNNGSYEIFTCFDEGKLFVYPYIKIPIGELYPDHYDITSPYGYCEPYSNDEELFLKAEETFISYIKSQNIVSEFVRYHYLYNRSQQFRQNISNIKNQSIVLLNTEQAWKNIWHAEFSRTNRNLTRKLQNEGYRFEIVDYNSHIENFIKLYYTTMNNVNADGYYFFDRYFFVNLKLELQDKLFIARVSKDDVTYCYSLFFVADNILTYYLSARNLEFPKISATNLMLSEAANWANQNNIKYFNLGGGLSDMNDDPLYKFKCNFSQQKATFYIGKRIYLRDVYNEIVNNWIALNGDVHTKKLNLNYNFIIKGNDPKL